ncbi:DNA polymerase III subunit epsilon [Qipengyuania citrea]|uniref:DNA polymerase III subunit epsilon n=1 Tax=Qipengyuania citrea TaxID=225971 RepID=UPI00067EEC43|nr:DNA polymerase III subunit epsilon [Qipengyuania citrea]
MINTEHLSPYAEELARALTSYEDYRVLRRVPKPYSSMPHMGAMPDGRCIAIVDCEIDGTCENDVIIELAIMLCFVDEQSQVIGHFGSFSWLQDPDRELEPKISIITGLGAQHLKGQEINDGFACGLLDRADLIVAHNSVFDAGFIERRYPDLKGRSWACSCAEVDWLKLGFDGRSQSALLARIGWFSDAHRAAEDVWALHWLLQRRQRDPGGRGIRTHLARLIEAADRTTVMVQAERAPFSKKDLLRARIQVEPRWSVLADRAAARESRARTGLGLPQRPSGDDHPPHHGTRAASLTRRSQHSLKSTSVQSAPSLAHSADSGAK